MLRVSWNTSLMAAQTSSVSTTMKSSTSRRARRNVSSPDQLDRRAVGEQADVGQPELAPLLTERTIASESRIWTPITLISGRTGLHA